MEIFFGTHHDLLNHLKKRNNLLTEFFWVRSFWITD